MSFSTIQIRYTLPIVNGFVKPADGQRKLSNRVTPAEVMTAIPGARVVDYRYNRVYTDPSQLDGIDYCYCRDDLVLELPTINAGQSYGTGEDYHETIRALAEA